MQFYWFEVVRTVEGQPDPGCYESGLSHNPSFDTSGKLVLEKFPDEETAIQHAVEHDEGRGSDVWGYHCPYMFQGGRSAGGLDVFYVGPCDFDHDGKPIIPEYVKPEPFDISLVGELD